MSTAGYERRAPEATRTRPRRSRRDRHEPEGPPGGFSGVLDANSRCRADMGGWNRLPRSDPQRPPEQ